MPEERQERLDKPGANFGAGHGGLLAALPGVASLDGESSLPFSLRALSVLSPPGPCLSR